MRYIIKRAGDIQVKNKRYVIRARILYNIYLFN